MKQSISVTELEGFPTNNLAAERNLSLLDRLTSKVTKSRNYKFTSKSIRNDFCFCMKEHKIQWAVYTQNNSTSEC